MKIIFKKLESDFKYRDLNNADYAVAAGSVMVSACFLAFYKQPTKVISFRRAII